MNACCIICSDRFLAGDENLNIAAGKCGHTFHSSCLETWLATSSTCPKCRQKWTKKEVIKKLYFEYDNTIVEKDDESRLLNDLSNFQVQLAEADSKVKTLTKELNEVIEVKEDLSCCYDEVCQKLRSANAEKSDLHKELLCYQSHEQKWKRTEKECTRLRKLLENYQQIERLVKDSENDSKELMQTLTSGSDAIDRLASMCSIIKREYAQCKRSKKVQRLELDQRRKESAGLRVQMGELQSENEVLKQQCQRMEEQLNEAEKRGESLRTKADKRCFQDPPETVPSASPSSDGNLTAAISSVSLSSIAGCSKEPSSLSKSHSKFHYNKDDSDSENITQQMNFRMTSAASKKSRMTTTTTPSIKISKNIIDRSPQVPILQNFRRGYNGLGGHTSFTTSLISQGNKPLRTINGLRKKTKVCKRI